MATPAGEELISEVKEIFRNYLMEKKHRQTPERFMVLEEIYRADGHFDADDMYFRMKNIGYRVSRATVYNTLDLLLESGLVQRHQFGKNQSIYERAYAFRQHDHMICKNCGKVIEFCDPRLQEIKSMLEKIHDFSIDGHSLHFYGTCSDPENCTNEPEKKPREKASKTD
ncbi:transcriptional repressor [Balneolales bacterium ANBcel1]|nr:transcriptional repressor [Balneolales bacterium ANBcel1]